MEPNEAGLRSLPTRIHKSRTGQGKGGEVVADLSAYPDPVQESTKMKRIEAPSCKQCSRAASRRLGRGGREFATAEAIFWLGALSLFLGAIVAASFGKPGAASSPVPAPTPMAPAHVAVHGVVVAGQPGSMSSPRAEPVKVGDVRRIVELARAHGSNLHFLVTRANSARTLGLSLRIAPPDDLFDAADADDRHQRAIASSRNETVT